jgi:hypothetical protein
MAERIKIEFISNSEEQLKNVYENEYLLIKGFSSKITELERIKTKESDQQIKLRVPPFFKQMIEIESKKNGRSKAAEILHRLRMSFIKMNSEELNEQKG